MITNEMSILLHTTNEHATQMNEIRNKNQTQFRWLLFYYRFSAIDSLH